MIEHKTVRIRAKTWTLLKQLSSEQELSLTLIIDNLVREHITKTHAKPTNRNQTDN